MLDFIDNWLNKITMYRLVFYYLLVLIGIAAIFGAFGILPYNPISIVVSLGILTGICWIANKVFAKLFDVPANVESVYITAFILTLIIPPITLFPFHAATFLSGFAFLLWASIFAMASKYIIAINKKHIFNPAAFAVALTAIVFGQYASWWVGGNVPLLAFVLIGGLLVVRKIQRFDLVLTFLAAGVASIILTSLSFNPLATAEKALIHTSLLFFAFIMLTEPLTTPPTRPLRIAYGAIVGALFAPAIHIGSIYSTPELALVVGNIFSYFVSPKAKYSLALKSKEKVGANIYDFIFTTDKKIKFTPGQYLEWTLDGSGADARGNRRYFTIASSPTENDLRLGIRFFENSSTFKQKLLALEAGQKIIGGQLAGDFTLPRSFEKNPAAQKMVFIAGGIGITPFRSMIKYLSDTANHATNATTAKPDITLLYSNRREDEIAYRDVFDEALKTIRLKTVYAITDEKRAKESAPDNRMNSETYYGRIDSELIKRTIPDYHERTFYISGTHAMVESFKQSLHALGVPRSHIKTDFFPGLV